MGVSTTHRINLSMWILIYSFSDTYYVWAACVLVRFSFLKLRQKRNKIMFVKQNRPEAKTKEQNQERVAEVKLYSLSAVSLPTASRVFARENKNGKIKNSNSYRWKMSSEMWWRKLNNKNEAIKRETEKILLVTKRNWQSRSFQS